MECKETKNNLPLPIFETCATWMSYDNMQNHMTSYSIRKVEVNPQITIRHKWADINSPLKGFLCKLF